MPILVYRTDGSPERRRPLPAEETLAQRVIDYMLQQRGASVVRIEPTPAERLDQAEARHDALVEELVRQGVIGQEMANAVRRDSSAKPT